jgi:hypothetical protein
MKEIKKYILIKKIQNILTNRSKITFEQPYHKTTPEKLNQKSRKLYQMMA